MEYSKHLQRLYKEPIKYIFGRMDGNEEEKNFVTYPKKIHLPYVIAKHDVHVTMLYRAYFKIESSDSYTMSATQETGIAKHTHLSLPTDTEHKPTLIDNVAIFLYNPNKQKLEQRRKRQVELKAMQAVKKEAN